MKTNPNDSAFNSNAKVEYNDYTKTQYRENTGLTKREYFAGLAMQGILSNFAAKNLKASSVSKEALFHADALIEALNKKEGEK